MSLNIQEMSPERLHRPLRHAGPQQPSCVLLFGPINGAERTPLHTVFPLGEHILDTPSFVFVFNVDPLSFVCLHRWADVRGWQRVLFDVV
jgi:hypothetical protein